MWGRTALVIHWIYGGFYRERGVSYFGGGGPIGYVS